MDGTETILVVEDDEALREYASEILQELGYPVLAASDGAAALAILDRRGSHRSSADRRGDARRPQRSPTRRQGDRPATRSQVLFMTGYTRNAIVHHGRLDAGINLISKPSPSKNSLPKFASDSMPSIEIPDVSKPLLKVAFF